MDVVLVEGSFFFLGQTCSTSLWQLKVSKCEYVYFPLPLYMTVNNLNIEVTLRFSTNNSHFQSTFYGFM